MHTQSVQKKEELQLISVSLSYKATIFSRLLILKKYGGIYLDNDIYVINNLDKYRRFEFTLGWPDGEWIGNMLLMGHEDARFITQFIDTYKNYRRVI